MFLDAPSLDPNYRACLLANTILEFGLEEDEEVAVRIKRHMARLEACFSRALQNAIDRKEVPPLPVAVTARYLTSSLQGIAVMAKGGASLTTLKDIVEVILSSLHQQNAA